MKTALKKLYYGKTTTGRRFRLTLLAFDVATVLFFVLSSMMPPAGWLLVFDYFLAGILSLDFLARMVMHRPWWRFPVRFEGIVDLLVILSLLAPAFVDNFAFLRVLRMLRLLRSYHVLGELTQHNAFFRRNEEVVKSTLNLFVFVFLITAVVFVLEQERNDAINSYLDALYFTVTTLTTTGFGDIIMTGTVGRLLAVVIMVFGVALFLRLVQTIFRPAKVAYTCPDCGLKRHDPDAVHCKHCGRAIQIETEGEW
ncbi:potassium channel family protein [Yunchengibacter salinarum]|uniref:potassium channel family protein n=1 Tax=Yunchengibacter salinarum TaxID=3133399 RepID=UPI0035B5BFA6